MKKLTWVAILATAAAASLPAADVAKGNAVYDKSCKMCHGADGTPSAAMAKSMNIQDLKSPAVQSLSDDDIKGIILNGKGKMRPVKSVTAADAENVAAYIHSLKK
jgi:mono/diheme cytochrome c family protein